MSVEAQAERSMGSPVPLEPHSCVHPSTVISRIAEAPWNGGGTIWKCETFNGGSSLLKAAWR